MMDPLFVVIATSDSTDPMCFGPLTDEFEAFKVAQDLVDRAADGDHDWEFTVTRLREVK